MKFEIEEKDGKVFVFVEMPYRREFEGSTKRVKIRVQTEDVVSRLSEKGIKHGNAIQVADVRNWQEQSRSGTWIFEKKKLDKPAESVILPIEEEKPAPKKRKSRAKKTTSK